MRPAPITPSCRAVVANFVGYVTGTHFGCTELAVPHSPIGHDSFTRLRQARFSIGKVRFLCVATKSPDGNADVFSRTAATQSNLQRKRKGRT